jgi:RNA polymerase-binding transcription factor DksA
VTATPSEERAGGTAGPPPDLASDLAALDEAAAELGEVERALGRLDEGTYTLCEVCGEALGEEVLDANPLERRCAAHRSAGPAPGG